MMLLPTTTTIVDKYFEQNQNKGVVTRSNYTTTPILENIKPSSRTLLQIIKETSPNFEKIITIAGMEPLLNDSQANMTIFVPSELNLLKTTLESCNSNFIDRIDILTINFEDARKLVNSVIVPNILTTTMMIQSAYTLYKTRNIINNLFIETPHCVQFEPYTFNKPPFGIVVNNKSRIVIPDILASNGIVHIVDKYPFKF
jgi:uncharacterized surface protein with fasciclin (FAS1) repeats